MAEGTSKEPELESGHQGSTDTKRLKRQRGISKGRFTSKVKVFDDCLSKEQPVEVVEGVYQEMCELFTQVECINTELLHLCNDDVQMEEYLEYMRKLEETKHNSHASLIKFKCTKNNDIPAKDNNINKILIKKVEPPVFHGDVREFPTFIKDFNRLVINHHGRDPFILKQCLKGKALEAVGRLDEFDQIWNRLHERFGSSAKVVDAVLGDILALKPVPEGNRRKLLDMITVVEQAWLDLSKIGKIAEISNANCLSKVERLLPTSLQREWTHRSLNVDDENKFNDMVKFLIEERKAIEYMEDDSRLSNSIRGTANHATNDDVTGNDKLSEAIIKLTQNQEANQKMIMNLSEVVTNFVTSTRNDYSNVNIKGNKCWYHGVNSHDIKDCKTFLNMDSMTKFNNLKKMGACYVCLRPSHISKNCQERVTCTVRISDNSVCGRLHHPLLHDVFDRPPQAGKASSNLLNREGVLLMMNSINSGTHILNTLFDPGSNLSMITHAAARKLGLKGVDVNLSLTKVGNQTESINSKIYNVPLYDTCGTKWIVDAVGFDDITSDVRKVDMTDIANTLGIDTWEIRRPFGKIDMLIGTDYCMLLPQVLKTVDNLQLLKSPFGYCVRGNLSNSSDRHLHIRVNHVTFDKIDEYFIKQKPELPKMVHDFFRTEELGVSCQPMCGGCKCGKCSISGNFTLKEERELELIDKGLIHDGVNNCWVADYPWIRDPTDLPNNYSVAHARLMSTEKRLIKLGDEYCKKYVDQIQDMIKRGVARKLSDEEIFGYEGPVFYLPHHEVHKPDSRSTPLRIVFNSSASYMGVSLNDFLAKGPDCLNNILGVLLRFREKPVGLIADIKKMYNSVRISNLDQNCHRFLWRDMNQTKRPEQYALTTVTFGDRPGGAIAMVALKKTAQMSPRYPLATALVEKNSYVDDLITSVNSYSEVNRLMHEVDELLIKGGFEIKEWTVSGDLNTVCHQNLSENEDEKVLGLSWNSKNDYFYFKVGLNFSKKVRKLAQEPNLSKSDVDTNFPPVLTRRVILRQIAGIYDPIGLIAPFTLKMKYLMRELILDAVYDGKKLGWDDEINANQYNQWKCIFKEMFDLDLLKFDRCLKTNNTIGNPDLIIFSDGSNKAYGAVAYVRWKLASGDFLTKLIASKCKLSPVKQITIPRIELCGAVLSCRLRHFIEHEMEYKFESVTHVVDSEIVRSQIQKESFRFNTFVANRVAEIQTKSSPNEWYWVSSELNIADYVTRGCKPEQLHCESCWQRGPEFLRLPRSDWPIVQGHAEPLPDTLYVREHEILCVRLEECVIKIERFNDFNRLLNVTARILNVARFKSLLYLYYEPNAVDLEFAEMFWVKRVQIDIGTDWNKRFCRLGPAMNKDGIITVGSRLSKWLKTTWNKSQYILLVSEHPFTKLLIQHLHERDHGGIETTLVKLQTKFWVPGARRVIKSIKARCVVCKKIDKLCESQCMGELPDVRLNPSPPFYNTSLDLFGPFWVKDVVKKRTKLKVYGVIFTCMVSRAVHVDITESYDTNSFLRVLRRFISIRGFPKVIYSDRGSQLMKANKELAEAVDNINFDQVTKFGRESGMTWKFTKSANAPWQNGCTEALIRLVKRAIVMSIGEIVFQYSELQTVMFEITNLLNERPIGMKPGVDIDLGNYLCPNDLLLGRASTKVPQGLFDNCDNLQKRFKFINEIIESFWRKWTRDFFPTLIIRSKWHVEKRNVQPGDIVIVKDSNSVRGDWKLAQVAQVHPGLDGRVRNVTLRYKPTQAGTKYVGQRDTLIDRSVHSIVVILPIEEQ